MRPILLPYLSHNTLDQIQNWILDNMPPWAEGAVMGMSGGVDSAVVASLTARAFSAHRACTHDWQYTLRAYYLPTHLNSTSDFEDANEVAEKFGISLKTLLIHNAVEALRHVPDSSYEAGNLISRLRAAVLWTKAGDHRSIVMGTGNKDEDYGVGYYTLTGDGLVHLNPIGFLSKRLVRSAAQQLQLPDTITQRVAAAGLENDQTDEKDLGYSYDFVELVTEALTQGFTFYEITNHPQINASYKTSVHKSRFNCVENALLDVLNRHQRAKAKAELVCPKIPNIVLKKHAPGGRLIR